MTRPNPIYLILPDLRWRFSSLRSMSATINIHSLKPFAKNHDALNAMPSAFISVSLSAAGDNPTDLAGLRDCVKGLERDTLWHPGAVHHAAGAMLFSAYSLFTKLAIKFIARRRGTIVKTSEDYDRTDYAALEMFIDRFVARAISSRRKPVAVAQ